MVEKSTLTIKMEEYRINILIFILISQNFREAIHILSQIIYIFNMKFYSTVSAKKEPRLVNTSINIDLRNLYTL